ncbi:MBL fold metallo-hydrolase, partial [Pseudomonas aeruginosa]|nr:MBL fold metallo-hydrolase [Pseudomonas aeruginosa]
QLAGRISPAALMFPQGSARIAEAMYSQGLHAQALHEAMAEAIAAIVERQPQRRWRLLELGAGTAAASRTVIARLAPLVQRGAEVDYLFTDVSSYFLAAARERFADQPWVRFGRFDMNGDLLDQGVAPHSVDILLSSGALNNALDTPALLAGLRELLSADAWLVIQELTREHNEISVSQSLMMENPCDLRDERRQLFVHTGQWLEWLAAQGGDLACGVVPVLRSLDLRRLDGLLLSHADNDHAGGAPTVASRFPPVWLVSGEPARLPSPLFADSCDERSWSWDGVVFEQWAWAQAGDSNDRSCVLRVEADGEVLLLTGDISRAAEHAWLARQADPRVDWLLAPHHGSRSSSGVAFVLRTRPRHVLVSRGWRNAFGHPHGEVMERYARVAAQVHDTARDGALTFLLGSRGGARRERDSAHFWREK